MTRRTKYAITAVALFTAGCLAGAVGPQLVIPPVRAGTNPTRWEHFCLSGVAFSNDDVLTPASKARVDAAGAEGWEMATSGQRPHDTFLCFKRPKL